MSFSLFLFIYFLFCLLLLPLYSNGIKFSHMKAAHDARRQHLTCTLTEINKMFSNYYNYNYFLFCFWYLCKCTACKKK